jgi:hypothetical protein
LHCLAEPPPMLGFNHDKRMVSFMHSIYLLKEFSLRETRNHFIEHKISNFID